MTIQGLRLEEFLDRSSSPVYGAEATCLIAGRCVLVTGAGGSIGSEICRQVIALGAREVWMLDNDGGALWEVSLSVYGNALLDDEKIILADICDKASLLAIFRQVCPDVVFHAAAHKYLTLLEKFPSEAAKTNVFGTESVVEAAVECGVDYVVNISTDKAARPTCALGWSKRLAEHVSVNGNTSETRIVNVRFGNVLGSRGSLLQIILEQIRSGRPVTITDADATRFFMTIPEAAGLVIEAACLGNGGETFVLDMGRPVRIIDIFERCIEQLGCTRPEVVYTGLRPGEKLHEELIDPSELRELTLHPRISQVHVGHLDIKGTLDELRELVRTAADPKLIHEMLTFY